MDFSKIFELQKDLDEQINKKVSIINPNLSRGEHNLQGLIGLNIEISELANEIQFFKYWKKNKNVNWEKVYEEYTDLIHFLVSYANFYNVDPIINPRIINQNLTYQFQAIFIHMAKVFEYPNAQTIKYLFELIVGVAQIIELDFDTMMNWYLKVNEKNYNRLKNDY